MVSPRLKPINTELILFASHYTANTLVSCTVVITTVILNLLNF